MLSELNQRLQEARATYYAGSPSMSDAEYDVLEAQLAGLAARQNETPDVLTTVGTDGKGRIPHRRPMRSIQNKYSEQELVEWAQSLSWPVLTLGSKWDGVSCSLTYEDGNLVKAVTRGDGNAGEDILPQVRVMNRIEKFIAVTSRYEIRGELMISRSTLRALNVELEAKGDKHYSSTRNLVAGTIKLKDLEEVKRRDVWFRPWEVLTDSADQVNDSALARLRQGHIAEAPDDVWIRNPDDLRRELKKFSSVLQDSEQEFGRDGLVLKVDSVAMRERLGVGTKFANYQVAFKAQNARTETVLRHVIWQVGRQGRLTPVGIIEPVELAGAVIERVTLNNQSWINTMRLAIGSRVVVVRSGDVIPQIVEVIE